MIAGGIVAAFLGVKAEGQSLESLAQPLTAEDARAGEGPTAEPPRTKRTTTDRRTTMTPMPPPKASTEGPRDRHVHYEIGQIVRALQAAGPKAPDELARTLGSRLLGATTLRPSPLPRRRDGLADAPGATGGCAAV